MLSTPRRRFDLIDLMVLIAATAAWLGGIRGMGSVDHVFQLFRWPTGLGEPQGWLWVAGTGFLFYTCPMLAAWTAALALLSLRQPRPRRPHLSRQPGWVACVAGSLGNFAGLMLWISEYVGDDLSFYGMDEIAHALVYPTGLTVAAAWLVLLASGRWRAEPTWSDRAGRLLGVVWVAMVPMVWARVSFLE